MTDEAVLFRAVLMDPEDDAPRLAFADLLDETGRPEWADLIRRQIAAARAECVGHAAHTDRTAHDCPRCGPLEVSVFNGYGGYSGWDKLGGMAGRVGMAPRDLRTAVRQAAPRDVFRDIATPLVVRRGFVDQVETNPPGILNRAAALFRAGPIRQVTVLRFAPVEYASPPGWCYLGDGYHRGGRIPYIIGIYRHWVPVPVFDLLDGHDHLARTSTPAGHPVKGYPTEADARSALGRAFVRYGRIAAGLEAP